MIVNFLPDARTCSALFNKCITKTYATTTDDDEDLDLVMPMYDMLQNSSNHYETIGSLWFYSKYEATNFNNDIANNNNFKYFKFKSKLLENKLSQPDSNQANRIQKLQQLLYH